MSLQHPSDDVLTTCKRELELIQEWEKDACSALGWQNPSGTDTDSNP